MMPYDCYRVLLLKVAHQILGKKRAAKMQLQQPAQPQYPKHFKTEKTLNTTQRSRRKQNIPHAIRWQVWLNYAGEHFQAKCSTPWCRNIIKVYDFQAGHIQAEANGGATNVDNLIPICATCNHSMGTMHFTTWAARGKPIPRCCFSLRWLWNIFRSPKPVYPVLKPIKKAPTSPLSNIFITPPENGVCIQENTYHPPPLQPDNSLAIQ